MKKLLFLSLMLLSSICYCQQIEPDTEKWNYSTDTSAYNGVSCLAYITGTCTNKYFNDPIMFISKTNGESLKFCLKNYPYWIGTFNIKFDGESIEYKVKPVYDVYNATHQLKFDLTLPYTVFLGKLKTKQKMYTTFVRNNYLSETIEVEFNLEGARRVLETLNLK